MDKISQQRGMFDGDGALRASLRGLDWRASPLGPPERWPAALSAVVRLMLGARFPMFVAWGPQLSMLYNDAYATIMGDKHPAGLGQPLGRVWAEIWPVIEPIACAALAGRASYFEDLPLTVRRDGHLASAWFTFS